MYFMDVGVKGLTLQFIYSFRQVKEALIGFSAASVEEGPEEEDEVTPALEELTTRVENQDAK